MVSERAREHGEWREKGAVTLTGWRELPPAKFSPPAHPRSHAPSLAGEKRLLPAFPWSLAEERVLHAWSLAPRVAQATKHVGPACGEPGSAWSRETNTPSVKRSCKKSSEIHGYLFPSPPCPRPPRRLLLPHRAPRRRPEHAAPACASIASWLASHRQPPPGGRAPAPRPPRARRGARRFRPHGAPPRAGPGPGRLLPILRGGDHARARRRPYFRTAEILTYGFQDLVFAPHGEHWRHAHRICSAHVLSAARSNGHTRTREREVAAMVRAIKERAGEVVDLRGALWLLQRRDLPGCVRDREDAVRSELFRELIEENTALLGGFCVGDYFPSLAWADALSGAGARACRNFRRWDELLEKVVQEHEARRHGDGDGDEKEEEDFVDVLLTLQAAERQDDGFELTRDAIKSLLADMFAAGTETTFIALEWAMSELVRNPASMHKLQRELRRSNDAIASATAAPYLRAVVKETLRLHPPVPLLLPRECMRDDVSVMGFHVAKGTRVFVNAWAVGRDPASWSAPEEFRPERFLTEEDREVDFRGAHFKFVPFGAGRRVCPGMQFGIATVEHALASLVRMFDWEMPGGAAPEELDMSDAPGLTAHHAEASVRLRLLGTGRSEEPTTVQPNRSSQSRALTDRTQRRQGRHLVTYTIYADDAITFMWTNKMSLTK
ncbi:hypothetical protein HU200_002737 [Digitaria exilis]|uniref:Cytochrome P450 n=1 Tax=Digitaria exilis TaxID=1010633 RepID=A0A835FYB2_9POAL|nr:hypothetical protein HU200_002737 [Digitaria exilis]